MNFCNMSAVSPIKRNGGSHKKGCPHIWRMADFPNVEDTKAQDVGRNGQCQQRKGVSHIWRITHISEVAIRKRKMWVSQILAGEDSIQHAH